MPEERLLTDYEPVAPTARTPWHAAAPPAPATLGPSVADDDGGAPATHASAPAAGGAQGEVHDPARFKRGHALTFAGLFLFTVVLYLRPYELIPALSGFTFMTYWIAIATLALYFPAQLMLEGNLTARTREIKLVALLVGAALLSMPLAMNSADAWKEFNETFIKAVLMFVVIVNVVRTERRLRALLWLALAVGCFLSLNAIDDFRAGRLLVVGTRVAGAIGGMFGNPNDMALHLVTMVPVAVMFFFTRRNPLSKLLYGVCAALLVAGIVVSFSRGGFLGLLGAAGVLAWKLGRKHRLAVALCLLLALGAFVALAPAEYAGRLGTIASMSSDLTGSSGARKDLLFRSILITLRHPLLGVGMGNFHIVSIQEAPSHNAYTQVSAELGIYAMVLYIWFIIAPIRDLRRIERETFAARRASRFYYFAVGLQAALVGYMVSSFFASVAYHFYVYYLVGYAVALRRLYAAEAASAEAVPAASAPEQPPDYADSYA